MEFLTKSGEIYTEILKQDMTAHQMELVTRYGNAVYAEGHKAALESVLKIIDDVCFIGNALDTYIERVQDETGTTIKERIEKIMEAQK